MLVLARQCAQEISFPDQHIRIEVLTVKPGVVRLGIEAPPDVRVLRGELPDRVAEWGPETETHDAQPTATPSPETVAPQPELAQLTRKGLTMANVGLGLARLQARLGSREELQQTLEQLHEQLQWLRDQWQPSTKICPEPESPPAPTQELCGV